MNIAVRKITRIFQLKIAITQIIYDKQRLLQLFRLKQPILTSKKLKYFKTNIFNRRRLSNLFHEILQKFYNEKLE